MGGTQHPLGPSDHVVWAALPLPALWFRTVWWAQHYKDKALPHALEPYTPEGRLLPGQGWVVWTPTQDLLPSALPLTSKPSLRRQMAKLTPPLVALWSIVMCQGLQEPGGLSWLLFLQ